MIYYSPPRKLLVIVENLGLDIIATNCTCLKRVLGVFEFESDLKLYHMHSWRQRIYTKTEREDKESRYK